MNLTTLMKFGENITSDTPLGEKAVFGLQVVGIGMGVVFGVLILLIGILQLFKLSALKKTINEKTQDAAPVSPTANTASAASAPVASSEEEKLVAIASAAIAASRGQSEVDFNVISIVPVGKAVSNPSVSAPVAAPAPAPVATPAPAPEAAPAPATPAAAPADGLKINAPLPGTVLRVCVSAGAAVKKGDVLCVLEAMKMENDIVAPEDGTVATVAANQGSTVNTGDLLFVIA